MSIHVSISIDDASRAVLARLEGAPSHVRSAILQAVDRENQYTIGVITSERLSQRGPETLGVVSNRLRESMRASEATFVSGTIRATIGSNVVYAGVHEFGIDAQVTVRTHSRTITKIFGKSIDPRSSTVREHSRHMRFPARAYIRGTLQQRTPNYCTAIGAAVVDTSN